MSGRAEKIRIGFMPLLDAAIPVVAARAGFAARHGLEIELVRETSWANVRDRLAIGHFDAAHLLAPLPIAAALGLTPFDVPLIAPMTLGHGGNAITVARTLWAEMRQAMPGVVANDPFSTGAALKAAVLARRKAGAPPPAFAVVHAFSSHNYELRYWLAASGIAPERDVIIAIVPPPYMADALAAGRIDGFCVGEPWNSYAEQSGSGAIILTKAAIWPHSPDKVLALSAQWAEQNPAVVERLMLTMIEAAQFCANPAHHDELAAIMAEADVLGVAAEAIRPALTGRMQLADGEQMIPDMLQFVRNGATIPRLRDAEWYLRQMIRWRQADADAVLDPGAVFRLDLYARAAARLGIAHSVHTGLQGVRLFDDGPDGAS